MGQRSPCLYRRPSPNRSHRSSMRSRPTPHAPRPTPHAPLFSAELFEPESERGETGTRVFRGVGPDGEEAAVADLLESAQVFFPIECPGGKAEAAGIR